MLDAVDMVDSRDVIWHGMIWYDMVWYGWTRRGPFFGFATTKLMSEARPAAAAVEAAKSVGFPGRCARARIHRPLGIRGFIPVLVGCLKGFLPPLNQQNPKEDSWIQGWHRWTNDEQMMNRYHQISSTYHVRFVWADSSPAKTKRFLSRTCGTMQDLGLGGMLEGSGEINHYGILWPYGNLQIHRMFLDVHQFSVMLLLYPAIM